MVGGHQYIAAQGRGLGRAGRVHVKTEEGGRVQVGGSAATTVTGTVLAKLSNS